MPERPALAYEFNWKLTLATALAVPLFVMLSLWQIDRGQQKSQLYSEWRESSAAPPVDFGDTDDIREFQRVQLTGKFLPERYWLRENQFHNGRIGYNVIMPFASHEGGVLAIDRGWVPGTAQRDYIPEITTPEGEQRIVGTLVVPSDSKLIREAETRVKGWPHKILEIDLDVLGRQAELALFHKVLRIDSDQPAAFVARWPVVNMSPAKHYGYAAQWALMALVVLILYIFASTNIAAVWRSRQKFEGNND